ncbi:MAG TPA: hypothetical protein VFC19_14140 [Candidatus Limnocylindrales bacterium]|nr:hypothetical protein [Candidatus Limnocylindrales bacterium]
MTERILEDARRTLGEDDVFTLRSSQVDGGGLMSMFWSCAPGADERLAAFLFRKGVTMREEAPDTAVKDFDDLIRRFGDDQSLETRRWAGKAMFEKAVTLLELRQQLDAARTFAMMAERHSDDSLPAMRELVAKALFQQAIILGELEGAEEEVAAHDDLIDRLGGDPSPEIRVLVAMAL